MICTIPTTNKEQTATFEISLQVFKLNRLCCITDQRSLELFEVPSCSKCSTVSQGNRFVNAAVSTRLLYILVQPNSPVTCTKPGLGLRSVFNISIPSIFKCMTLSNLNDFMTWRHRPSLPDVTPLPSTNFVWPICQTSKVCRWHNHLTDSGVWWMQISSEPNHLELAQEMKVDFRSNLLSQSST